MIQVNSIYHNGFIKAKRLESEKEMCWWKQRSERNTFEGATLLTLKMEEGAVSQGMWATSRIWSRQGNRLYLRASRRMHPTNSWLLGSLTSRTEDKMCVLSLWGLLQYQQEINTSTIVNVNDTFCICLINHGHSHSTSTCVPGSCLLGTVFTGNW